MLTMVALCTAQDRLDIQQQEEISFPARNIITRHGGDRLQQEEGGGGDDVGDAAAPQPVILRTVVPTVLGRRRCGRWKVWSYYRRGCVWGLLW